VKRYDYIEVSTYHSRVDVSVNLRGTSPQYLEELFVALKKVIPSADKREVLKPVADQIFGYQLHKLNGRDEGAAFWIIRKLCSDEWEPFAASSNGEVGMKYKTYHFRRLREE
jgi:hypothetical protein